MLRIILLIIIDIVFLPENYRFRKEMETKFPRAEYENVIRYITSTEYVPKNIHQEIIEMNEEIIDLRNAYHKKEKEYMNLFEKHIQLENKLMEFMEKQNNLNMHIEEKIRNINDDNKKDYNNNKNNETTNNHPTVIHINHMRQYICQQEEDKKEKTIKKLQDIPHIPHIPGNTFFENALYQDDNDLIINKK